MLPHPHGAEVLLVTVSGLLDHVAPVCSRKTERNEDQSGAWSLWEASFLFPYGWVTPCRTKTGEDLEDFAKSEWTPRELFA